MSTFFRKIDINDFYINELDDGVKAKVLYRDFTNGLYITAYSRLNLFCYALYLIYRTDARLIYSDTDSWKVYGDIHNAVRVNEEYNHFIEGIVHNSEDYNIGYFDYEELYAYFATLGCKKYITSDGEKIKCTIATHGNTADEVIFYRVDSKKENLGLTNFKGKYPSRSETEIAKNYLTEEEITVLNRMYLHI